MKSVLMCRSNTAPKQVRKQVRDVQQVDDSIVKVRDFLELFLVDQVSKIII